MCFTMYDIPYGMVDPKGKLDRQEVKNQRAANRKRTSPDTAHFHVSNPVSKPTKAQQCPLDSRTGRSHSRYDRCGPMNGYCLCW
jgi:hypothetical protein